MFTKTRLATAALTGVLSLAVTGAAAFAALQPPAPSDASIAARDEQPAPVGAAEREGPGRALEAILDRLVANGTITKAQEEAILKAIGEAPDRHGERAGEARGRAAHVRHDFLKAAVDYLGIERGDLMKQRAQGKSLGEIADATPGKSKSGLVAALTAAADRDIDEAVAKGKLTAEQAAKAKAKVADAVQKLVDMKRGAKPASR